MKKLVLMLSLSCVSLFCFSEPTDQKKLGSQENILKKQLLGNSVTGALACFVTASAACFPSAAFIILRTNLFAEGLGSINPIASNVNRGSLGLTVLLATFSYTRYGSAYVIPYSVGFILSNVIAKELPGIGKV